MTEGDVVERAAAVLRQATASRVAVEPLTQEFPGLTVDDAWRIQEVNRELLLADGRRVVGYKVGLTSKAMQEQMGVDEPDFGVVLDDMVLADGVLRTAQYVQPRLEAEIALVLDRDIGSGATPDSVLAATRHARPALEIIDSRIRDWRLTLVDTVADNASSGAIALGEPADVAGVELADVRTVVTVDGAEVASGLGAAALGHPAVAAAWLANRLGDLGLTLTAGSVVMTGSLHASFPAVAGQDVVADFGALGSVGLAVR
jgi:2-keto-4-pentenoate hydratase